MERFDTYCGLYCGACVAMRARLDGNLPEVAARFGKQPEDFTCHGCKSDKTLEYCSNCPMKDCCRQKGYESCAECADRPCPSLRDFSQQMPHRKAVAANLAKLAASGMDEFLARQKQRWTCPQCGRALSWYEEKCSGCGVETDNAKKEAERIDGFK